jgi:hypothetical protein
MAMTDLPVGMRGLHYPFRRVRRPIQKPRCLRSKDAENDANGVVGSDTVGLPADGDAHSSGTCHRSTLEQPISGSISLTLE